MDYSKEISKLIVELSRRF